MTELVAFTNEIQYSMVLREGFELMLPGLIMGLLIKLAFRRLIGIVHSVHPIGIIITMILIGATSLLACYLPARRASNVEPMDVLRYE